MEDKQNNNTSENSGDNNIENFNDSVFDYEELLNDLTTDGKSHKDDINQSDQDQQDIKLSELVDDTGDKESENEIISELQDEGENLEGIFNELDDAARESVMKAGSDDSSRDKTDEAMTDDIATQDNIDETGILFNESISTEDSDYASILSEIGSSDTAEISQESAQPEVEETAMSIDEQVDTILMDENNAETPNAGFDSGEIDVSGDYLTMEEEEINIDTSGETEFSESAFTDNDLMGTIEEPDEIKSDEVTVSAEHKGDEIDFLGLSNITGVGTTAEGFKSGFGATTEVLFEGVEMDFDEQIKSVTLAEVLLAQGKKKDAAELFSRIATQKGVTHWVSKRLKLLSS